MATPFVPSRSLRAKALLLSALPHLWSTGTARPPASRSPIPHSPIANTLTTSCSGRIGKVPPRRRKTSNGRAPAGTPCVLLLVEGSYGNYVSDEGDSFARAAYGRNYD